MNNLIIPPSPSWYLSNIITCNDDGIIAYGARHEVIIMKTKNEISPYNFEYSFIPVAHKERITCLAFAPKNTSICFKNCIATASDDGTVRIWDIDSLELKMANSGLKDTQKIVGVDWSSSDPNVVISISEQAILHCWDLASNRLRKVNLGSKITPLCVAACPHDKQLIAVGAKNGLLFIVDLRGEGNVKYRMRSHDADLVSLSWCPVAYNIFQQEIRLKQNGTKHDGKLSNNRGTHELQKNTELESDVSTGQKEKIEKDCNCSELLLASGSKDRVIYFWRIGTDGRYETFITLPQQPFVSGYRAKMNTEKGGFSVWGCIRWVDPYTLLSGSQFGELLLWDLTPMNNHKTDKNKKSHAVKNAKLLHGRHSKGVFSICCPVMSSKPSDDKRIIWTTALDRKLVACSLKNGEILTDLTTIGGIVYCMAISPLDPNRIAIGAGDGKILIWNMGCTSYLDISSYWQKINSKVMSMDWHPTEENWLAFGTGEGRVAVLDINSSKPPIVFRQHHHRSVYRVLWAPHVKEKYSFCSGKYELALYSVGDGEVLQHSVNAPEKEPVKIKDIFAKADESSGIEKTIWTDFVMNHDRSLIAVGNENGIVYILDGKTYEKQSALLAHKKLVQCVVWHPSSVTSDPSGFSPCLNWVAVASDNVKVFSISPDGKTSDTVAVLSLQTQKIVDVSWSPHLNGHLVSVSYDYTAQVWDVIKQTPLVNYNKHHNAVLCGVWSPINPEFIITGSYDNTLRVWRISEQTNARPHEKKKNRITNLMRRLANVPEAVIQGMDRDDIIEPVLTSVDSQSKIGTIAKSDKKNVELNPVKEWEAGQLKHTKGKSLFPVNSTALSVGKHLDEYYQRWKANKIDGKTKVDNNSTGNQCSSVSEKVDAILPPEKELSYLDFFGDGNAMKRLMSIEEAQLTDDGRLPVAHLCVLWKGDVTELLQDAMNKKQLNDWLMSLAPMSSMRIWQEACIIYSEQLANQGDPMKAACYLLAVHKVEEAVQLLCDHKYFREAVALAKCRLPNDDSVVQEAVLKYANYSVSNGMLNLAAHCFLSLGDPLSASRALARCKDLKSLKLAALLASEANAVEIADTLAKDAFCSGLMAGDFNSCSDILSQHPNLEFLKIWIGANKMLVEKKKLNFINLLSWLQSADVDTDSVLDKIKEVVKNFGNCYDKLKSNVNCFAALDTEKQLWLFVSSYLSLAGAANSNITVFHHLVQALAAAYRFQTLNNKNDVLIHICTLLSPKGPLAEKSIFTLQADSEEEKHLLSSMRAFLLAGTVSWLNEHLEEIKAHICGSESSEFEKENFIWLESVIVACEKDLFDHRNLEYFKNETMIKNLELKIASSKCNFISDKKEQRVMLTAVRTKDKKAKKIKTTKEASNKIKNDKNRKNSVNVTDTSCMVEGIAVTNEGNYKQVVALDKDRIEKEVYGKDKDEHNGVEMDKDGIKKGTNGNEIEDKTNNLMVDKDAIREEASENEMKGKNNDVAADKNGIKEISRNKSNEDVPACSNNKFITENKNGIKEEASVNYKEEKSDELDVTMDETRSNKKDITNEIEKDKNAVLDINKKEKQVAVIDSKGSDEVEAVMNVQKNGKESTVIDNMDNLASENPKICLSSIRKSDNLDINAKETELGVQLEKENDLPSIQMKNTSISAVKSIDECNTTSSELINKTQISDLDSKLTVKVVSTLDNRNVPSSASIVIECNKIDDTKSLQLLNAKKLKFESEKVSVPNPFFTYCQLQNILTSLLKDDHPNLFDTLNNKIQESWKHASTGFSL
ncbi:gem nuclear organelle associated protein rigor mortis isoform X2 [Lycorma delicatula]|uniref:gem nuclear organelle associated protein rigor mortis isoform X2 n=1 Tax=Lycorma delicatula TaxID=130591 RepID=UPI003F515B64